MISRRLALAASLAALTLTALPLAATAALPKFTDHYANDAGVKIHYVSAGRAGGPLVVMIHGYPDYWYTWRNLMAELAPDYRVVAIDQRGYNLSDKPEGVDAYKTSHLVDDVAAVIKAEGRKSAIVIGHDWGASVAWNVALSKPELVDRLVIMSVPHPANMARELKTNPVQQKNSQYARNFQKPGAEDSLTAEGLAGWVKDPAAKPKYVEAFKRSNFTSMLNFYRANYPTDTGAAVSIPETPPIKAPVLVIHGMKDTALNAAGHNGTWDHVQADTTILMLPGAGHWIEQDAGPLANRTIKDWLAARPVKAADQMAKG